MLCTWKYFFMVYFMLDYSDIILYNFMLRIDWNLFATWMSKRSFKIDIACGILNEPTMLWWESRWTAKCAIDYKVTST